VPFRVTVIKRAAFTDLIEEYVPEPRKSTYGPCRRFEDGQVFEVRSGAPWIKQPGSVVTGCTDGLRPVSFLVERVED